jgi:ABC-type bacteriocin/lantibiotic exporter with double-glycine peptidase domain
MTHTKTTFGSVFKTIIWPRRKVVMVGLSLILVSRMSSLVLPWASKYLIDDVIINKDLGLLKWLLIAVVSAILIQSVTSFLLTKILSVEAQYLISELRVKVQKKILSLPISFFDNQKSGALVS